MIKARVYKDIFVQSEIQEILNYFAERPIATVNANGNLDKNLDYHIESSLAYNLIKPKITTILGEHSFQNGSYKECVCPYPTHIDNQAWWTDKAYTFNVEQQHECFLLIPLTFDTRFRTVIFDVLSEERLEMGEPMPQAWMQGKNNLTLKDFTHFKDETREQLQYLPIDMDITWQVGDIIRWHKNQLHCSTNFAQFGLIKKFVLLGIG